MSREQDLVAARRNLRTISRWSDATVMVFVLSSWFMVSPDGWGQILAWTAFVFATVAMLEIQPPLSRMRALLKEVDDGQA